MSDTEDTNAAVWKSDIGVSFWKSRDVDRSRRDAGRRGVAMPQVRKNLDI